MEKWVHNPFLNLMVYSHLRFQWRIQDFPKVGAPTLGAPTYDFAKIPKNCMKLKEFGPLGGACIAHAHLRSATGFITRLWLPLPLGSTMGCPPIFTVRQRCCRKVMFSKVLSGFMFLLGGRMSLVPCPFLGGVGPLPPWKDYLCRMATLSPKKNNGMQSASGQYSYSPHRKIRIPNSVINRSCEWTLSTVHHCEHFIN